MVKSEVSVPMMRCVQCGRDYPERQAFCHQCGEPLRPREAPVEAPVPRPRAQATLGRSRAIARRRAPPRSQSLLFAVLVLLGAAVGLALVWRHAWMPSLPRVTLSLPRPPEAPPTSAGSASPAPALRRPGPAGGTGTGAASSRRTRPRAGRDDASPAGGNAGSRTGPGGPRLAAREASPRPGPPRRKPAGAASVGPSAGRRPISTASPQPRRGCSARGRIPAPPCPPGDRA